MSKRVIVIGGGVIGLCTAYYCARRGLDVTVVERKAARRDGASFGNAGMVVPSHFIPLAAPGMVAKGLKWMLKSTSPFYIKPRLDAGLLDWGIKFWRASTPDRVRRSAPLLRDLSLASRACFEEFAAQSGVDFDLVKKGLLMLCQTKHALEEEAGTATQARELGIPAEVLDEKQTAALDPAARMAVAGSVFYPMDCHLEPDRLMAALQAQAGLLGAQFIWDTDVLDFKIEDGRRIRAIALSGDREIEGDEFVLCGGAWSAKLAARLPLMMPLQAGKGYSLTLPKPRQMPQICSILAEARVAVTPMGDTLRVGGTMELGGLCETIAPARVHGIIDAFCRYFPEFDFRDFDGIEPRCGLRPCSPDGLPYLGRTAGCVNLSIAAGHSMMGVSLGPITGKLMAGILAGERNSIDISMLSPDRYN